MTTHELTPATFVEKWKAAELSERAASHEHFIDLCRLLGQPTPADHDATGAEYAFEKGISVSGPASKGSKGDYGFADAWWKGKFAWEYKRKDKYKSLDEAYSQLLKYREALENPPLLVVSDIARIQIHTNFTGTAKCVHEITLDQLTDPGCLDKLRRVFTNPDSFKPTQTTEAVTAAVAAQIGHVAQKLRERGHDPHAAAHFLMKCMFCLFAEDIGLLPNTVFKRLLERTHKQPERFEKYAGELFTAMRAGGDAMLEQIPYFNGGLFDEGPPLPLSQDDLGVLLLAAKQDWSAVEPAIFGTLFERSLDPAKRAQIGAHYTSREDILLVIEPVIMAPLRREWSAVQAKVEEQLVRRRAGKTADTRKKADNRINQLLQDFLGRLASVRILDPACGSGNFLYVAIQQLLSLEKEVIRFSARPEIGQTLLPQVRPTQLHGIEINPYAAELAQVVIWIGYLQWMHDNGFNVPRDPILAPLQTIENRDAILAWADGTGSIATWREGARCLGPAQWPKADFVIGNPPFLGSKVFRQNGLPDGYVSALFESFELPKTVDLCCYWFDLARRTIGQNSQVRAGLLATQAIRGGDNRKVLEQIKATGDIFYAWPDREWVLDGAAVHVSIVGFDGGVETAKSISNAPTGAVNADLSSGANLTTALRIPANCAIHWSIGTQKGGDFDLDWQTARTLLCEPSPSGLPPLTVVRPWDNGSDITGRNRGKWVIYFDPAKPMQWAAATGAPFDYVSEHVRPFRATVRRDAYRERWWLHQEARLGLDANLQELDRFIVTPTLSKHRVYAWQNPPCLPDKQLTIFLRQDDFFFGVLHCALHETWARRKGTQLREVESGFRYTPTTCFETYPLPWPPGQEDTKHEAHQRISAAAKELNDLRERWLNPPEWIEPIARIIDAQDDFADVPEQARPLIRQSAIMAAAAKDAKLKKRTLTNLYNERPTWLRMAHEKLDRAVLAAYAATDPEGGWSEAWAEVWTETGAGQPLPDNHPLAARRAEMDQKVLANLLRLNHQRAHRA